QSRSADRSNEQDGGQAANRHFSEFHFLIRGFRIEIQRRRCGMAWNRVLTATQFQEKADLYGLSSVPPSRAPSGKGSSSPRSAVREQARRSRPSRRTKTPALDWRRRAAAKDQGHE